MASVPRINDPYAERLSDCDWNTTLIKSMWLVGTLNRLRARFEDGAPCGDVVGEHPAGVRNRPRLFAQFLDCAVSFTRRRSSLHDWESVHPGQQQTRPRRQKLRRDQELPPIRCT